ncbi:MAG TPA: LysR family transcriptional regulator [Nocardioidaceae bacterium]|nr:LysR family transcriptional regulator [Nocardioidaceae bacterium]
MTRPDLEDLAVLALVARTGSIGRAAEQLQLSQPSVSRRMGNLEKRLRVRLLRRSPRGTTLTPAGQLVVDWAAGLLDAADEFTRSVEALRQRGSRAVRAAVSMTIAEHHAPGWVARLHPDTSVSLLVRNSTEVADLVEAGTAEVGFVESPTVRRRLTRRRVGWDELAIAVHPSHPWASGVSLAPADVAGTPLLVREEGSGTRGTLERALRRHGLALTVAMAMASNTALKSAALAGMGPVVLSELAVSGELAAGALVRVQVRDLPLRRPLTAVWRRDEPLSEGAAALVAVSGV